MSSSTLSSRQLVRLARNNKLSLPLRFQWQRKNGVDPINSLRCDVRYWNLNYIGLPLVASPIFGVLALVWLAIQNPDIDKDTIALIARITFPLLFMGGGLLAYASYIRPKNQEGLRFGKQFSNVLHWFAPTSDDLRAVAEGIVLADLPELRSAAKPILVTVAERILLNEALRDPENIVSTKLSAHRAKLDAEFADKYAVLEDFGLVYGGHKHFFDEARKRREDNNAKAAAAAAQAATPAATNATAAA